MKLLEIKTYPDKFLTQPTKPVENIDGDLQNLIGDMALTMYGAPGIGLAAIQVGIDKSLVVYDISPREEGHSFGVLVNPVITAFEGSIVSENEGCLSVPDFTSSVNRHRAIEVAGLDRHGNPVKFQAEGLMAIMLQHEIDHLEGKLFIDRISKLKRELYIRRVKKQLKNS
jgi:peptide deformylase